MPTTYSCNVCGKSTFKTNNRLMKHMRIHSNQRPFSCQICKKEYNASSSLKAHQRMAHNMNNSENAAAAAAAANGTNAASLLQCTICKKTFVKPYHLSVHMNTVHDNERPFACPHCSYRFSTSSKLSAHVRSMHTDQQSGGNNTAISTTNASATTVQLVVSSTDTVGPASTASTSDAE